MPTESLTDVLNRLDVQQELANLRSFNPTQVKKTCEFLDTWLDDLYRVLRRILKIPEAIVKALNRMLLNIESTIADFIDGLVDDLFTGLDNILKALIPPNLSMPNFLDACPFFNTNNGLLNTIKNIIKFINTIKNLPRELLRSLVNIIKNFLNKYVLSFLNKVMSFLRAALMSVYNFIKRILMIDTLLNYLEMIIRCINALCSFYLSVVKVWNKIESMLKPAPNGETAAQLLAGRIRNLVNSETVKTMNKITDRWNTTKNKLSPETLNKDLFKSMKKNPEARRVVDFTEQVAKSTGEYIISKLTPSDYPA